MSRGHRPRKRFGQHFLTDPGVIDQIVSAIGARADDTLVEIGPGQRAITEPLTRIGAEMHLIEFDRDLVRDLEKHYASAAHVHIHEADALKFDFRMLGENLRVVGNLPYNISTPLLFRLLEFRSQILDMHFMLQKEVVDRMAAVPGSKNYGRLTIMLGCFTEVEPLFDVSPEAFHPPPKVISSVARVTPRPTAMIDPAQATALGSLVAQAFSKRRKTLHNALKGSAADADLEAVGISPGARAEEVPIDKWIALTQQLASA